MNKTALRNFATKARIELLERVELQALKIGISKDEIDQASIESSDAIILNGKPLEETERKQRDKLIQRIEEIGYDRVMEETAYTWFNRFVALRFMEVNNYLPTRVRVLSSDSPDSTEPDMMREALELNLDIDKQYIYDLKMENKQDELFKYLIQLHCNDLNKYMPFMFETLEDYMMILFPEGLLGTDSFLKEMTDLDVISEEDWGQVEIIGWLYQYYIADEKDEIFKQLKKNVKITKDTLPAATQLFTPNWIVRYLVENSLGKIWTESYPESNLHEKWTYYLEEAEQDEETLEKLKDIRYSNVNPEEITFLDPSCGSGHILVYAFDVFYDMYVEKGYVASQIPQLILEKNLYGIDIDERAAQLASFSLMMKAREKTRRIFRQAPEIHVTSIEDTNWLTNDIIESISNGNEQVREILFSMKEIFTDAKEYGSLIHVDDYDYDLLIQYLERYTSKVDDLFEVESIQKVKKYFPILLKQSEILKKKYDVVCTNPPYMGRRSMSPILTKYLDKSYPNSKSDLFAVFIERGFELTKKNGFNSMVTMQSWMFLKSYENMRRNILNNKIITTLLHMDNMVMGIAFGTSASIFRNSCCKMYKGRYTEIKYMNLTNKNIPDIFPNNQNRNGIKSMSDFTKIPGNSVAYWISNLLIKSFDNESIKSKLITREGMATADNKRFLKYWYEIENKKIGFNLNSNKIALESNLKWFPYNKGGAYRKWYGNNDLVVNWENDGFEIKNNIDKRTGRIRSHNYNGEFAFKKGITWSALSSGDISIRFSPEGFLFDSKGAKGFSENKEVLLYIMGILNSKVGMQYLDFISPTMDFKVGDIIQIPLIKAEYKNINKIIYENINVSKSDWDSYETSWDFENHPLLVHKADTIEASFNQWSNFAEDQFNQLKANEEKLNEIFIEIYGLEDELTPEVDDKDVTVRKADLERDVKSFISYAVGCSFGRYSLDEDGLIYAGGDFDASRYSTFPADDDNILPVLEAAYFEDDIVNRFIQFVKVTYGAETMDANLQFIAEAIGKRANETAREAIRRYFMNHFYKDHTQTYKKHPIYWLFSSGKEKAFNCLIYMHRYDKTTLSRIRTDYLHDVQTRYETRRLDLIASIDAGDATAKDKRELKDIEKKIEELKQYDEKLHHMADMQIEIDLDDGVKVNYKKFDGLLAKI